MMAGGLRGAGPPGCSRDCMLVSVPALQQPSELACAAAGRAGLASISSGGRGGRPAPPVRAHCCSQFGLNSNRSWCSTRAWEHLRRACGCDRSRNFLGEGGTPSERLPRSESEENNDHHSKCYSIRKPRKWGARSFLYVFRVLIASSMVSIDVLCLQAASYSPLLL